MMTTATITDRLRYRATIEAPLECIHTVKILIRMRVDKINFSYKDKLTHNIIG